MKKITLLAMLLISMNLLATNYYWVGGSGNWSDYINHWATTSGGAVFHNQVPQATDNVYFDANSFSSTGQTVTIDQTVVQCADLDWTGSTNSPALYGDNTTTLKIYGSLTLAPGMNFNVAGQISMEATTTGKTITTFGIPLNTSITFNGIGGEYTLQDSLTVLYQVYLNNGTLNTNNQTLNIASFISTTSSTRVLNLGSSIINLSNHWYVIWNINPTGMTLNAGTSKMYASNQNGDTYFTGGGFTYNDLSYTGSQSNGVILDANTIHNLSFAHNAYIYGGTIHDVTIGGNAVLKSSIFNNVTIAGDGDFQLDNTFNNLTLSPGHTYTLQSNQTQTVNSLTVNGNCGALINILKSSYPGSQANISSSSGAINVSFVTLRDLNATGGATFTANNAIDLGNNTGWTINTLPSKNLYWVGNSGNWDDGSHWATSSGGNPSGCSPTPVDNVFFDANSFSLTGQTVTVNSPTAYLYDMNWTGVTNNPTITGVNTLKIYGSLTLASSMAFNFSGTLSFEATTMGHTITTAGITINTAPLFNGIGGGWTLQDELNTPFLIYLNSGSLNTNSQTVNASGLWSNLYSTRALTTGTSIFNMSGATVWDINPYGMTMDAANSTINGTASGTNGQYFAGAQFTYKNLSFTGGTYGKISGDFGGSIFNDVSFAGGAIIYGGVYHTVIMSKQGEINGNNTFNDLTLSAGYTYTLQSSQTQTILHSLTVNGNCGALINILKSSTIGSQANISSVSGAINVSFVTLKDINATGGATFTANNAIDLGNNTGWTINALPSKNLYWIGNSGNWDDGSHWSISSGGSPLGCSPTPVDNVFFDANSFSLPGQSVTANIPTAYFNNMDWTGVTNNPTLAGANTLQVYGSLTLSSAMTFGFSGTLSFEATTMGHTITTAGTPINTSLTFNGIGGGWTLLDELTSPYIVYFNNGSLNTNNQTVNVLGFISNITSVRVLTTGTSTFNISGQAMWFLNPQGMTFNAAGSTIKGISAGGSQEFYSNGFTYNDVFFTGGTVGTLYEFYTRSTFHDVSFVYQGVIQGGSFHDVSFGDHAGISGTNTFNNVTMAKNGDINGNNTFNNLSFSPGYTYTLGAGQTQTVNNICAQGTGGLPIRIQSSTAGTAAIISKASGTMCWNYVRVSDITGTGGAIFNAGLAPTISEDMGGNSGLLFTGGCTISNCTPCITPSITAQPNNNTVCAGSNTVFATTATGTGLSYQWQLNPGTGFTNLSNSAPYTGVTTNALNISTVTPILNGYQYRCIVTDSCTNIITTSTATITIVAPPIATSSVSSTTVTVFATGGTPPYTGTGIFTSLAAGTYTYTVTDANGCTGTTTATVIAIPGSTCAYSIPFTSPTSCITNNLLNVSGGEMWFSFTAGTTNENIQLRKNPTSLGHIHTMAFYSGTCSSLNIVDSVNVTPTNDSLLTLNESNLTAGNTYYIKAEREFTSCPLCVNPIVEFDVCIRASWPASCTPTLSCNLIQNHGFELGHVPVTAGGILDHYADCWEAVDATDPNDTPDVMDINATCTPPNTGIGQCNDGGGCVSIPNNYYSNGEVFNRTLSSHRYACMYPNEGIRGTIYPAASNKVYYVEFWTATGSCYNKTPYPNPVANTFFGIDNAQTFVATPMQIPGTGSGSNIVPGVWSKNSLCVDLTAEDPQSTFSNFTLIFQSISAQQYRFFFDDFSMLLLADAGPDHTFCQGGHITIGPSCPIAGATYSWTSSPAGFTSTEANPTVNPAVTTIYTVSVNYGGCYAQASVTITVDPLPNITVNASPNPVCVGQLVTLTANGANSYSWSPNGIYAGVNSIVAFPLVTTTYTVTGTDNNGCSNTATAKVIVNTVPIATATPSSQTICSATATSIVLSSNPTGATFSWTVNQSGVTGASAGNGNTIIQTLTNIQSTSGTATYTITPSANGCIGLPITVTITVNPFSDLCPFPECDITIIPLDYDIAPGNTVSTAFPGLTSLESKKIRITGTLTINHNFEFSACTIIMAPNGTVPAKIIVANGATLTLSPNTHKPGTYIHGCPIMWTGIEVQNGGKIIDGSSSIEDAISAVKIMQGAKGDFGQAIFNRNLTGIELTSNNAAISPITISGTIFTSRNFFGGVISNYTSSGFWNILTTYAPANLKAPYTHIKGLYGINATDVKVLNVGDAIVANDFNGFDAIMCGINLTRTNATIYNNQFQNLLGYGFLPNPAPPHESGYGIKATGAANGAGQNSITVGGTAANQANSFTNTYRAVSVSYYKTNNIIGNSITNTQTGPFSLYTINYGNCGIYIYIPASNNDINISKQTLIKNCETGIFVNRSNASALRTHTLIIDNNNSTTFNSIVPGITADQPSPSCINCHCTNGIYVTDGGASSLPPITWEIKTNTITEAANAIYLLNVKKPNGPPSMVYDVSDNISGVRYAGTGNINGIEAKGCKGISLTRNHTKCNSTAAAIFPTGNKLTYGIYLQNSSNMLVKCNKMDDAARSLVFQGVCTSVLTTNTNPKIGITQNTMYRAQDGFVILSTGIIGTQGNATTVTSNNYWDPSSVFSNSQTFTETSGANTTSKLFMNSGASTFPTNNKTNQNQLTDLYIPSSGLNISTAQAPTNCVDVRAMSNNPPGITSSNTYNDELRAMVEDSTLLPVYSNESHWMRKQFVYDELKNDTSLNNNSSLQHFYNSTTHNYSKFTKVEDKIDGGQYNAANAINNSIVTSNVIESNQQTVNELILQNLITPGYIYTANDTAVLAAIANQCPLAGGYAVYQARNLLMTFANNVIEFTDNCTEAPKRSMEIMSSQSNSIGTVKPFKLYPNPNNGNMQLDYQLNEGEKGVLVIRDIMGKKISEYNIPSDKNTLSISEEIMGSGVYFYQVLINDKIIKTDKILIIK